MAARTKEQIYKNLQDNIKLSDPTVDTVNGVIPTLNKPMSNELAITEDVATRLARLHNASFTEVATDIEVEDMARSMRMTRGSGTKSIGKQLFYTNQNSIEPIVIELGTIVGTTNSTYLFKTTERFEIQDLSAYYNISTSRYEITLSIEAIVPSFNYNLPERRITELVSNISNIEGTYNVTETAGGTDSESISSLATRIQDKFIGFDRGTINGIKSEYIKNFIPSLINDIAVVQAFNDLYNRLDVPGLDIYITEFDAMTAYFSQTYTIDNDSSPFFEIQLENSPVTEIVTVIIERQTDSGFVTEVIEEGINVGQYVFLKDNSKTYGRSYKAEDIIKLNLENYSIDDTISIQYGVNKIVVAVQEGLFNSENTLFETDVLIKEAFETELIIEMKAKPVSDPADERSQEIIESLELVVKNYIENGLMNEVVFVPEKVRQDILSLATNISEIYIKTFRKKKFSYKQIETVYLNKNETAKIYRPNGLFQIATI